MKFKITRLDRTLLMVLLLMGTFYAQGQQLVPGFKGDLIYKSGDATRSLRYPEVSKHLGEYSVYSLDVSAIYNFVGQQEGVRSFKLQLGNEVFDLNIWKNAVTADNYTLRVITKEGVREQKPSPVTTYKGFTGSNPENKVRMSIREEYMVGVINVNGEGYVLQPVNAYGGAERSVNEFVLSNLSDQKSTGTAVCDFNGQVNQENNQDIQNKAIDPDVHPMPENNYRNEQSDPAQNEPSLSNSQSHDVSASAFSCTEIAVLADYAFYQRAGSDVTATENRIKDMLNLVQDLYDALEIQHKLVELVVDKDNAHSTLTNPTNADNIQVKFLNWANSNFKNDFDVATIYTGVDIVSSSVGAGLIGRAYYIGGITYPGAGLGGVCNQLNINIVEYWYASWGNDLTKHRVDWAHELGHNWGAQHVNSCGSCVMTPSLNGTQNQWASGSKQSVNNFKASVSCLDAGQCSFNDPPVAEFSGDKTDGCGSLTVQFTDGSQNSPTSWAWDFGDGSTSAVQNPSHTYNAPGTYTVKLTTTNEFGNNTATKTGYITVGTGTPYQSEFVGLKQKGTSGGYVTGGRWMGFDAYQEFTLVSIKVYSDGPGTHIFSLGDQANETEDSEIRQVEIPGAGEHRIELNMKIPPGVHALWWSGNSTGNLWRDQEGVTGYPFTIPNLISINETYAHMLLGTELDNWYIGYDWEVRRSGCDTGVGVREALDLNNVTVYPNPGNGLYTINLPSNTHEIALEVMDLTGRLVQTASIARHNSSIQVDLSGFPEGAYILKLTSAENVISKKIIKY